MHRHSVDDHVGQRHPEFADSLTPGEKGARTLYRVLRKPTVWTSRRVAGPAMATVPAGTPGPAAPLSSVSPVAMSQPDRLRSVFDQLLRVLDEHRDTLWNGIDHRTPESVSTGTDRYQDYLRRTQALREAAADVADFFDGANLFGDAPSVAETPTPVQPALETTVDDERPVRPLDASLEHVLDKDFTHTRPAALRVGTTRHNRVDSWRRLYELVLKSLAGRDPDRFARLPTDPRFISSRERHDFSRRQQDLRGASLIADGVYAEVHFSANDIRTRIVRLLDAFGLPASAVGIYLESARPA